MSNKKKSSLNQFWDTLLNDHRIQEQLDSVGYFLLSTQKKDDVFHISEFAEIANSTREARLLTKFDHQSDLPQILKTKKLSVISVSNTDYIVSHVNPFFTLETKIQPPKYIDPKLNRLIDPLNFSTEKDGITVAFNSGIFTNFLGEKVELSINGRFGYDKHRHDKTGGKYYSKYFPNVPLTIGNTQIEVDASFENDHFVALVEANDANKIAPTSFNLRQLYYPLREFRLRDNLLKFSTSRSIRPIYMNTHNHFLTLFELELTNELEIESFKLVRQVDYKFKDPDFENKLRQTYNSSNQIVPRDGQKKPIVFPQADKVISLLLPMLSKFENPQSTKNVADLLGYENRQGQYYANALAYIGLVNVSKNASQNIYSLSTLGKKYILDRDDFAVASHLVTLPVFREMINQVLEHHSLPDLECIKEEIKLKGNANLNSTTMHRRAQTVRSILSWVLNQLLN
ncbi:type II restriction enzyme [Leuconostoc citreum]